MAVAVAAVAVAEVVVEPLRSARESGQFDAECLGGGGKPGLVVGVLAVVEPGAELPSSKFE